MDIWRNMKIDKGVVVERLKNAITIKLERRNKCVSCALAQFCGDNGKDEIIIKAVTSLDIVVGDRVELLLED
jgi:positive regulator of sigma E activity